MSGLKGKDAKSPYWTGHERKRGPVLVHVTSQDIQSGRRGSMHSCAMGLAVARALGIEDNLERKARICIDDVTGIEVFPMILGENLYRRRPWPKFLEWFGAYHKGHAVLPIRFELEAVPS